MDCGWGGQGASAYGRRATVRGGGQECSPPEAIGHESVGGVHAGRSEQNAASGVLCCQSVHRWVTLEVHAERRRCANSSGALGSGVGSREGRRWTRVLLAWCGANKQNNNLACSSATLSFRGRRSHRTHHEVQVDRRVHLVGGHLAARVAGELVIGSASSGVVGEL